MRLVIDRFEGKYAICEDEEQRYFAIVTPDLPDGAGEGSVLTVSETGEITLDQEETRRRRELLAEKQRRLFDN